MKQLWQIAVVSVLGFVLSACGGSGGGGGGGGSTPPPPPPNNPPFVDAGPDQFVDGGDLVMLDGTVTDSGGASSSWSQLSGPAVTLSSTTALDPSFTAPDAPDADVILEFQLTGDDGVNPPVTDTVIVTVREDQPGVSANGFIENLNGRTSDFLLTPDGDPAPVNVTGVATVGGNVEVTTHFIPDYRKTLSAEDLSALQARPFAGEDFPDGIQASEGERVEFGQSIGYSGYTCPDGAGGGYWPTNNFCPKAMETTLAIPAAGTPSATSCRTDLGLIGVFVNGVGLFNWSDGKSYRNEGVWHNATLAMEQYDFDLCTGHASGGVYHHHGYSPCLAERLNDEGTDHSPVYGYAGDGYPIHGPWVHAGRLAESCWRKRDYSAASATGCGTDGARTCVYSDPMDITQGTVPVTPGPTTSDTVYAPYSQNPVAAASGTYLEDYYFDANCPAAPEGALDAHNGHDHDGLGYHYHLTVDAQMRPTFPYAVGPDFAGTPQPGGTAQCAAPLGSWRAFRP